MKRTVVAVLACCSLGAADRARAETLYDTFRAAFAGNEVLGSQRAAVRVGLQDKIIAETGYLPSVTQNADFGYDDLKGRTPTTSTTDSKTRPRGYGLSLSQNVFNGFRTSRTVEREDASLRSARDKLCDVEQQILLDAATVYADVIRDRAIVELHERDRDLLEARAKQTRFRYQIGEVTRTDVDQSEAGLAQSRADLIVAKTNLEASATTFRSVVGQEPGPLEPPAIPERLLPRDVGSALAIADAEHPAIRSALNAVDAARANVDVERAGYLPSVDITASSSHRWDPESYPAKTDLTDNRVLGHLTIPLFDRGLTFASVQRATELTTQSQMQLDHQRVVVRSSVIQNRNSFLAAKAVIAAADAQIAASTRALAGVDLEATAGQRTTLDVLIAQHSLLTASVNREIAQHDRIVAGYRFLAAIGRLMLDRIRMEDTRGRRARTVPAWTPPAEPALDPFLSSLADGGKERPAPAILSPSSSDVSRRPVGPRRAFRGFPDGWTTLRLANRLVPYEDGTPPLRPYAWQGLSDLQRPDDLRRSQDFETPSDDTVASTRPPVAPKTMSDQALALRPSL